MHKGSYCVFLEFANLLWVASMEVVHADHVVRASSSEEHPAGAKRGAQHLGAGTRLLHILHWPHTDRENIQCHVFMSTQKFKK